MPFLCHFVVLSDYFTIFVNITSNATDMKRVCLICLYMFISAMAHGSTKHEPNVVIEEMTEYVKFIPDKSGTTLHCIENTTQYTFRANRSADKAMTLAYYNDHIRIDKASGGDVKYGAALSDDVFFSDAKACRISATLKKGGATAKITVKRTYTSPEFFCRLLVYELYDMERAILKFEIPASLSQRYSLIPHNLPDGQWEMEDMLQGDSRMVTFTLNGLKPGKKFADAPSIFETVPQIKVLGHFADVNGLYRYLHGYIPTADTGAHTVAECAAKVTSNCSTDREKIKAIYDYVHQAIHYVAVEHGDLGHRPDLASEVLRKRFGDCKGSAILLRDMLRSLGFDARLVWIGTTDINAGWTEEPNMSSGNHMIAAVMLPGDSIVYLDGTSRYSTPENPPDFICGQEAMIEDGPQSCIIRHVPPCKPENNTYTQCLTFIVNDGMLNATGSISCKGSFSRAMRRQSDELTPAMRQELHERIFSKYMPNGKADEVICTVAGDSTLLTGTVRVPGAVKDAGASVYVNLNLPERLDQFIFDMDERTIGGIIGFPATYHYIFKLCVPDSMSLGGMPAECAIDNQWVKGAVTNRTDDDGRSLIRDLHFTIKKRDIPLDSINGYNADIRRLARACSSNVVLNRQTH